jgi:arabinogalactan endo-1,4-beta-galactosidase
MGSFLAAALLGAALLAWTAGCRDNTDASDDTADLPGDATMPTPGSDSDSGGLPPGRDTTDTGPRGDTSGRDTADTTDTGPRGDTSGRDTADTADTGTGRDTSGRDTADARDTSDTVDTGTGPSGPLGFARGADVGWLSEMEASRRKFYDAAGVEKDLLDILSEYCINAIRLRVWVNPANGWCGKDDVVAMAQRAYRKGFRIMIDFHYSDNWADPGKQNKPAAWENHSVSQLAQAVYDHTHEVLLALKSAGVVPEWVQIGNETNDGMLWPDGRASASATQMGNYANFVANGHAAAKAVFPQIITIVHVSNGFDNGLFRWNIGGLLQNGANFDAIAMSLYPDPVSSWKTTAQQARANMDDLVQRFQKPVLVTEIGLSVSYPNDARDYIAGVIALTREVAQQQGLGVFWWEPQAYNWRGYDKVAWDNNGRPTEAMEGFRLDGCPASP